MDPQKFPKLLKFRQTLSHWLLLTPLIIAKSQRFVGKTIIKLFFMALAKSSLQVQYNKRGANIVYQLFEWNC